MSSVKPRRNWPVLPVGLTTIFTGDGIRLEGVIVHPRGRKRAAIIWVHGLTSSFHTGQAVMEAMIDTTGSHGIGYFKFNTRGSNILMRNTKGLIGSARERFTESVYDIDATIRLAEKLGYKKIILAGHSTGANKITYYQFKRKNPAVKGLALLAPASDIAGKLQHDKITTAQLQRQVRRYERARKRNSRQMMLDGDHIYLPQRFVSLYKPNQAEDTFPYYSPKANWKALKSIRTPMFVCFGEEDAHLDRPATELIGLFEEKALIAQSFTGHVVEGADHGFHGHEQQLSRRLAGWTETVI